MDVQVCDRCRRRKIKCDGRRPRCSRCSTANAKCTVSATLLRKTKPRGYVDDTPTRLAALQQRLEQLEEEARLASAREEQLKIQLLQKEEELATRGQQQGRSREELGGDRQQAVVQPDSILRGSRQDPEPILGHIGQMLQDDRGIEVFLGAHTGIYFVSSAARQARKSVGEHGVFPDWVFGLFFTPQRYQLFGRVDQVPRQVLQYQSYGTEYCVRQVTLFCCDWGSLYPVIDADKFCATLADLRISHDHELSESECCVLFQLYSMMAINTVTHDSPQDDLPSYDAILASLFPRVWGASNLESLRGLLLYTLVLQIEGRSRLAVQTNGVLVRLAQTLGLHRHSRRFKHQPSEVEWRKRLWWCVFICDTNTTIHQGLPRLIRPADVDVEFSMNTDCPDHSIQQLPVIVPGDAASSLGLFRQYISLYQILSETLDQLYTTWGRRDGVSKIRRLEHKLNSWRQTLQFHSAAQSHPAAESFALSRLAALTEFAHLLIHRPALSFDASYPQFTTSLVASVRAAEALLTSIHGSRYCRLLIQAWPLSLSVVVQLGLTFMYPFWVDIPAACLSEEALRERIAAVCELARISVASSPKGAPGESGADVGAFLETLCEKTLRAHRHMHWESREIRVGELSGGEVEAGGVLGDMDFPDWQSLMLPNEFLFSEWDLTQSFR